jgi:hypothetical protein
MLRGRHGAHRPGRVMSVEGRLARQARQRREGGVQLAGRPGHAGRTCRVGRRGSTWALTEGSAVRRWHRHPGLVSHLRGTVVGDGRPF